MKALGLQFARFGLVGVVATACHYAVLLALVELGGLDAVLASTAGAVTGAVVNYALNYRFTFVSDRPHRHTLPRFMVVAAAGFLINAATMAVLVASGLFYLVAQIVSTVVVLLFNFFANRTWTFKRP